MTLTRYGYLPGGTYTQDGWLTGTEIAQPLPAPGQAVWLVRAGAQLRCVMGDATLAFGVWAGSAPGAKLGNSDRYAIPYNEDLYTTERTLSAPVLQAASAPVSVGHLIRGTSSGDDWDFATQANDTGALAVYRMGQTGLTDPFGTASSANRRGLRLWVWGQPNRAPDTPSNISPANGATVTTGTPTIAADFRDADETLRDNGGATLFGVGSADKLAAYQITVKQGGTTVWTSGVVAASSGEQSARRLSHAVGTTLASGAYTLAIRVQDLAGAWSGWSSSTFTVSVAAVAGTSPTGKIAGQTTAFGYTYTNTTSDHANRVAVRLRTAGGVIATSPDLTVDIAPGGTGTVAWSDTGFASLTRGTVYTPEWRVRYGTANIWTPWTPAASFRINAAPSKPPTPQPNATSVGRPAYPTITARLSDPDDGAGTLTGTVEITQPDSTVLTLTSGANDGAGLWSQVTTSTQFGAQDGTYQVRVKATDAQGLTGPWSDYATITWGDSPAVTDVTLSPVDGEGNVTGLPLTISWQVAGTSSPTSSQQAFAHIQFYPSEGDGWADSYAFDQATTVSFDGTPTDTVSYSDAPWLANDTDYEGYLLVRDGASLSSTIPLSFHVAYTPPAPVPATVLPVGTIFDTPDAPTMIRLDWAASDASPDAWRNYRVWRQDGASWRRLATVTDQMQTTWTDPVPPAGTLTYAVTQDVQINEAVLTSDRTPANVTLALDAMVLTDVVSGEAVTLPWYEERIERREPDTVYLPSWDGPALPMQGLASWQAVAPVATVLADRDLLLRGLPSQAQYLDAFRALTAVRRTPTGFAPRVLCYRDARGRRFFGMFDAPPELEDDNRFGQTRIRFSLREVAWTEGGGS